MVKKGKKKQQAAAQAAAASSTSGTDPSTSEQQSSQPTVQPKQQQQSSQQQLQKKRQAPQMQSQLQHQSQPQQQPQEKPQQQAQGPSRTQQSVPPSQSQPSTWGARMQQPAPRPQVSQPSAWGARMQQPEPRPQVSQPSAWGTRMQQPAPRPQVSQPSTWGSRMQQPAPQPQVSPLPAWSPPHMQQFQPLPQQFQPPGWRPVPPQRLPTQRPVMVSIPPFSQQQISQSQLQSLSHMQPPLQQQISQQYGDVQLPQGVAPQQIPQQPVSVPVSTLSPQLLAAGDSQQVQKTVKDGNKNTKTGVASGAMSTSASSVSELSKDLSHLSIWEKKQKQMSETNLNVPRRQNPNKAGTLGRHIRVITNMFEIIFKEDFVTTAIHYDVKVVPIDNVTTQRKSPPTKKNESKPKRELKNKTLLRKIFEQWRLDNYPDRYPAYDGMANAFAAREFSFADTWVGNVNVHDDERAEDRTFQITINKAGIVDLSWLKTMRPGLVEINKTALQVLDIILRHAPSSRLITVGRSFFPPGERGRVAPLEGGLDLHMGGFTSAVIGWKPYLNLDVSHKAFVSPKNVVEIISEMIRTSTENLDPQMVYRYEDKINKALSGLKVCYVIPNQPSTKRTHKINGLGPDALSHKFEVNGQMCSTQQYFDTVKKYKLKYPRLPCLWVGRRDGKIYLPAELCNIVPGQAVNRKLDEIQTSKMIKFAATNTDTRKDKIRTAFGGINVNNSPVLQNEFHLGVAAQMKEVDARVLPPPALQYNDRSPAMVNKGVWRAKRFREPAILEDGTWTIVNVCQYNIDQKLPDFVDMLQRLASQFGMRIGKPQVPYQKVRPFPNEIEKFLRNVKNLKLIIVVLPDRTDAIYGTVKKISELRVGVLTQCIKSKNVNMLNNSTIQNILLKINSKLNGINHTFIPNGMPSCLRGKKYMLIGADVSHPSPDAKEIPSVAAVAASHDETTFKYNVTIRLQQPKQEEIADLKEIMLKHIRFYVKEMNAVPEIIVFYRDGVSEGQIGMVLEKEIKCIKDAFREYAKERPKDKFKPQLTFVIVQKRHHIRIFPKDPNETDDRNRNVRAGTIVDTEITHPSHIDFYLVSHASIQGTARPTKYRCISNESNFNEDQLEEMTYHLCHMYARCTRSVSYPAPTYYAHLAAYRGRMWIQGDHYTEEDFRDQNKCKLEPILKMPMSFI